MGLLCEFLLTAGQLLQTLQRLVHRLLFLATGGRLLPGLILILLGVEFEVEEILEVATATATTAAPALLAEGHLDIAAARFGTHQELQSLLFVGQGILEAFHFQLLRSRTHLARGGLHLFHQCGEGLARARKFAALHALGQAGGLRLQLALHIAQELGVLVLQSLVLRTDLIPRGRNDLLLAFGDLVVFLFFATATTAAALLRLRVVAFKGLRLNKVDVGLGQGLRVTGHAIQGDDVARDQLKVLQRHQILAIHRLRALGGQQVNDLFLAAIHRVVQFHRLQAKVVFGGELNRHLLQRIGLRIATRLHHANRGWQLRLGFDEVVLG